jgi:transcriptional regulator with XRE-family HTH domain
MAQKPKETPANLARNAKTLAKHVKRLRLDAGLSQEGLAEAANLRQALVSEIEREESNPTLESLTKLADALKVDLAELFARRSSN